MNMTVCPYTHTYSLMFFKDSGWNNEAGKIAFVDEIHLNKSPNHRLIDRWGIIKKEILLRNLEANLLYGDYSEFAIQSDASMTLIIKEKGE